MAPSERREFIRFYKEEAIRITTQDERNELGFINDISLNGVRITCDFSFDKESEITITIQSKLSLTGKVASCTKEKDHFKIGIYFGDLTDSGVRQLSDFIFEFLEASYQPVNFEGFKFLVHCLALDGFESREKEILWTWLKKSDFSPELVEIISISIQSPPSSIVAFQLIKDSVGALNENDPALKALIHNLGVLMSTESMVTLHAKLIVRTVIETIPKVSQYLDEFVNPPLIQSTLHYMHAKQNTLGRLNAISQNHSEKKWVPTENELWVLFLTVKLGGVFSSHEFIEQNVKWYSSLLQPYFLINDSILQELIQECTCLKDIDDSELVEEFLIVADPDQRSMLIEIMREMMNTRPELSKNAIDTFVALVKGRGNIKIVASKEDFVSGKKICIGTSFEHDLVLPTSNNSDYCIKVHFESESFKIVSDGNSPFYVGSKKHLEFSGSQHFLEFRIDQITFYFFSKERLLFYEESPHHYLAFDEYDVIISSHGSWIPFYHQKQCVVKKLQVAFRTGEFIGIFGPTGSGKSTLLLSLLNRFETRGNIWIDGISYKDYYTRHYQEVGYVPQDDVLHRDLTVNETLHYSIALRGLARNTEQIKPLIKRTLKELGLEKASEVIIGDEQKKGVSGGQRKRVNLALELISENTCILMLDEPTSGLDPGTELQTHQLLRTLTSRGLMILMVSHSLYEATMNILDMALILTDQGELAYYGPSIEAKHYFNVQTPEEIFNILSQQPSSYWVTKYRKEENSYYRKYNVARLNLNRHKIIGEIQTEKMSKRFNIHTSRSIQLGDLPKIATAITQFWVFCKRLFQRQIRDGQSLASRIVQAVLLAFVLRIAYTAPESGLLMLLSIVPVWLGATTSVRSVNSEYSVFLRERRFGIYVFPYMLSIFMVNAVFVLAQNVIFLGLLYHLIPFEAFGFNFNEVLILIYLTSLTGVGLGMFLSTLFTSEQASVNTLPVFLVLMILFGGSVIQLKNMDSATYHTANVTPTRWVLEGLLYSGNCMATTVPNGTPWEVCGSVDEALGSKFDEQEIYPLELNPPKWEPLYQDSSLNLGQKHPKVGVGLRRMGFFRTLECSFEEYDHCPPALIHEQMIKIILVCFTLIMLIACMIVIHIRTRRPQ